MWAIAVIAVSLLANGPRALQNAKCIVRTHHFCKEAPVAPPVIIVMPEVVPEQEKE